MKFAEVKGATLITGRIGTGKTLLAQNLRKGFEAQGVITLSFDDPREGLIEALRLTITRYKAEHLIFTCSDEDYEALAEVCRFLTRYKLPLTQIGLDKTRGETSLVHLVPKKNP